MNLLIACPNKFRYSETFIHNQIEALSPKLLVYEGWYPSVQPNGQSFLPFPLNILAIRGGLRRYFPNLYHQIFTYLFAKYLKNNQIDLVLANYGPMGAMLADACEQAGVPLAVHFHGFDAYHVETLKKFEVGYQKMFRQAQVLIAVSKDMQAQLIGIGASAAKVIWNPYGVNLEQFGGAKPEKQAPVFISVGRFTAKKSPQNVLKAFAQTHQVCPEARLLMVGDGELWEEAKQLANELAVSQEVTFLGVKKPTEVASLLLEVRAFVQHSMRAANGDSEGTPNTVLEASATGLPIIGTRHAGIKDAVVEGETGFLVDEGDVKGMAEAMIRLANDAELAGKMGKAARGYMVEHFSLPHRTARLKEILSGVLNISK